MATFIISSSEMAAEPLPMTIPDIVSQCVRAHEMWLSIGFNDLLAILPAME